MFIPLKEEKTNTLRPVWSDITENDWNILADYWYPVAVASNVADKPVPMTILDVGIVLFRGADDRLAVALDDCPHRHIRLSAGKVLDGHIQCPFHGLEFDHTGKCTRVPALGDVPRLPPSYCVKTFPVVERFGLVWTCIGDGDKNGMPTFPSIESFPAEDVHVVADSVWPASAARQIENFFDLAHLPFTHELTLGGSKERPIKPGKIVPHAEGVTLHAVYTETFHAERECDYTYRIVLPFSVEFTVKPVDDDNYGMVSCDLACPTSAHECQVFQIAYFVGDAVAREDFIAALNRVNTEDIDVLSQGVLLDMPLTQHYEIHLPVDNASHAYRTGLKDLGLGQ